MQKEKNILSVLLHYIVVLGVTAGYFEYFGYLIAEWPLKYAIGLVVFMVTDYLAHRLMLGEDILEEVI